MESREFFLHKSPCKTWFKNEIRLQLALGRADASRGNAII